jgi:hypothetical protein
VTYGCREDLWTLMHSWEVILGHFGSRFSTQNSLQESKNTSKWSKSGQGYACLFDDFWREFSVLWEMRDPFVRSERLGLWAREQLGYLDDRYRVQNLRCHFLEVIMEHGYRICKTRNKWIIHTYRVFMKVEISNIYEIRMSCKNYMGL